MRIPTMIDVNDTLESNVYESPVLTIKDEGLVYVSPFFALAYFTLRDFMLNKLNEEQRKDFLEELEDDRTYYTVNEMESYYHLDRIVNFELEGTDDDIVIQPTRLFYLLLESFPKEYIHRELYLSSRRRGWTYDRIPIDSSHLCYARIFGLEVGGNSMLRPENDFTRAHFGGTSIKLKSDFASSYALSENPPTDILHLSNTPGRRMVANISYRYDFFTLLTAITLIFGVYVKGPESFSLDLALKRAMYYQKTFVEEANELEADGNVKDYMISRLTNKERRELMKSKKEHINTDLSIRDKHTKSLEKITSTYFSRHSADYRIYDKKEYFSQIKNVFTEQGVSRPLRAHLVSGIQER